MPATTKMESQTRTNLEHLKRHVKYPTDRKGVVAACAEMSDVNEADKQWIKTNIPEGTYRGPEDVLRALLAKV